MTLRTAVFAVGLAVTLASRTASGAPGSAALSFDREVRPILAEKCFVCHGPDEGTRKAGLRLDQRDSATRVAAKSGRTPIVPGRVDASELVRRIDSADDAERMPPPESKRTLSAAEKETLRLWIESGAEYEGHWAFRKPARPEPPRVAGARTAWVRNPIDAFVLARLEAAGLAPSPEADRATLARRVHLDLTGLPPSVAEVDAFVRDPRPDAYERLVDAVLASPRYGEKMALQWLDLARFGDTNGYHFDSTREMWLWRDGVIASFNADMPFDRFAIEQLAGDLVPRPTLSQRIASGFNRNTRFNEEGGADPEEFVVTYAKDRVNTLGQAFLGLTLGCAECHSHKYDPISHREYYELYAFFNSIEEPMVSMNHGQKLPPLVAVPFPEQERAMGEARRDLAIVEARIADELSRIEYVEPPADAAPLARAERVFFEDAIPDGATANPNEGPNRPWEWVSAATDFAPFSGARSLRRAGSGLHQSWFTGAAAKMRVGSGDRLFAHVLLDPRDPPEAIMLQYHAGATNGTWNHRAYWGADAIDFGKEAPDTDAHRRIGELPEPGVWARLEFDATAVGLRPGAVVNGIAFTAVDGDAYFDRAGILTATPQTREEIAVVDDDLPPGAKPEGTTPWEWVEGNAHSGTRAARRQGTGLTQHFFTGASPALGIREDDVLFAWVFLDPADPPKTVALQWHDGNWEHRAYWGADLVPWGKEGSPSRLRVGDLPKPGEWTKLEVAAAAVGLAPKARVNGFAFTQFGGTALWDEAGVATFSPPDPRVATSLAAWEEIAPGEEGVPAPVKAALAVPRAERTPEQSKAIRDVYLRFVYAGTRATFEPLEARRETLEGTLRKIESEVPTAMVSAELEERRPAYVLTRGDFLQRAEEVTPNVPAILPPLPPGEKADRLALARWVVSSENPLTARVLANRLWAQLFGEGIVRSLGDFGTQGDLPSHPELLDWLATELVRNGWSVKGLLREIVLSATYRQSSVVTPGPALERDPSNRLLSRAPRFRLGAEEVRDNALAIAGLLSGKIGGPSVMPYQPADFYKGKKDDWPWQMSPGEDRFRRGMYTFWRRTCLHPSFAIFDAPSREQCTPARPRTNTPLQALTTLNDPTFVEAARVLAQRVLSEGRGDEDARLASLFRRSVARAPEAFELAALRSLLAEQRAAFAADPAGAEALANYGDSPKPDRLDPVEHAAWTALANVVLNLDETITRE